MATIKDVAQRANVSVSTVSKYINGGEVRPQKAEAVRQAIEELDYKVNPFARMLKTRKSYSVGVLLPALSAPFFGNMFAVMEQQFRQEGYHCTIACYSASHGLERDYLKYLISTGIDGLVYIPERLTAGEYWELTMGRAIPLVQLDRMIPDVDTDTVLTDNVDASCEAVSWLLDQGHSRVAAIMGSMSAFTARERLAGYLRALERRNIPYDDALVVEGQFDFVTGYQGFEQLMALPVRPTAILTTNYDTTIGLLTAARERGVRIPEDVGVFGYDCADVFSMMSPTLPTVQQPEQEMGRMAAELLLRRLNGWKGPPRMVRLKSLLVGMDRQ